jgi:hypothetical protein
MSLGDFGKELNETGKTGGVRSEATASNRPNRISSNKLGGRRTQQK